MYSDHGDWDNVRWFIVYPESVIVTRPSVFAGFESVWWKKSKHKTGCLVENSNFYVQYIKTLQYGKTWCGLVKCKNLPDLLSCEKYKLSGRLYNYQVTVM